VRTENQKQEKRKAHFVVFFSGFWFVISGWRQEAMIWFACRQCGKTQGRPDEEAGTLIFCPCGVSNRVPWESSIEAPAQPVEPPDAQGAKAPQSERDPSPIPFADGSPPAKISRRTTIRERNPAYCLNHQDVVKQQACVDCQEGFCDDCLVVFQGKVLCGPCKNFRIRQMHRPAELSLLALFSPILAVAGGFVALFMSAIAVQAGAPALGFISVAPQLGAFGLGLAGMRRIENDPFLKGRPLAMTGMIAAVAAAILSCFMTIFMQRARE
jgi:hypothetical protein